MTSLTGKSPSATYKDLVQVSNNNGGIDGTLRPLEDGEGTTSALQVSTTGFRGTGPLDFTGTTHAGVTLNNLTTAQRNALTALPGMAIFNTTTGQQESYNGTAWVAGAGATGPQGPKGDTGNAGATGSAGPAGAAGSPGQGVPTGGAAGQVLTKNSGTNYDASWATPSSGGAALARIPGGTNCFLPTTNQAASNGVSITRTWHYCAQGGTLPKISFGNWQTAGSGEQLSPPNMVAWDHYALIEYNDDIYPCSFGGQPSARTAVGAYVVSDPVPNVRVQGGTWYAVVHVAVMAGYRSGSGAPPAALGANGDYYYDVVGRLYYQKAAGSWGTGSSTNPIPALGLVIPVTHVTRGAFGEFHSQLPEVKSYHDGGYPRGAKFKLPDISTGTLTFSGIGIKSGGQNMVWEGSNFPLDIMDLSQVGPGGGKGTPAAGYANFQGGSAYLLTATTATGTTYKGPLAIGLGVTTQGWGPSAISIVPDYSAPWLLLEGDSIVAGVNSSDGDGDQYRQFGIYQRLAAQLGNPTLPTLNWGIAGLTAQALISTMTQSRAMFLDLFGGSNSNVLTAVGTNDYQGGSGLASVKASIQTQATYNKTTRGFRKQGLATILPRTTSTDAWATETNQTPISAAFNTGGDVLTHNSQILANTFITNQDFYVDLRSYVQGTNPLVWKTAAPFTASANSSTYGPTADGIHPSKYLMVLTSQNNGLPSLST